MRKWSALAALVAIAVTGCREPTAGVWCLDYAVSSFVVTVIDSTTGAPVASGARMLWRQNHLIGSDQMPDDTAYNDEFFIGPWEVPGNFSILVARQGYKTWKTETVVSQHACHVIPIELTARLHPL